MTVKGRIYKISACLDDACEDDVYFGSTKKQIQARFLQHIKDYNSWKNGKYHYVSSYKIFEKYTPECCEITLLEEFYITNDDELFERESHYILNNTCVNEITPSHNAVRIKCACGETYTYKHKARHLKTKRHNELITGEKKPLYKETHKQEIYEWKHTSFNCDCGGKYQNASKAAHLRCKKHLDWIDANKNN